MVDTWKKRIQNVGLLALGFVASVFGISLHTGESPVAVTPGSLYENSSLHLASENSCLLKQKESETFFLSCGGIF